MSTSRDDFSIAIRSALLQRGAKQKFSLFVLILVSIFIFVLDNAKLKPIEVLRSLINDGIYRLTNISTAPFKLLPKLNEKIKETAFAMNENKTLKAELENLKNKEFQVEFLKNQNWRSPWMAGAQFANMSLFLSQLQDEIKKDHIKDMVNVYLKLITAPKEKINYEVFNVGGKNQTVMQLAKDVKSVMGKDVKIVKMKTNDKRSYHISSDKISRVLKFKTRYTVKNAARDLKLAFQKKLFTNPLNNKKFFNIKTMQAIKLK